MNKTQQYTHPSLSRRALLRGAGSAGALGALKLFGSGLLSSSALNAALSARDEGRAWAQASSHNPSARYLLYVHFDGGWDLLLGLDPRDPADFPDADAPLTGVETAYTRLPPRFSRAPLNAGAFSLGPCAAPLLPWAERLAVVRGLDMGTLTHEVGRRYLNTARPPAGISAQGVSISSYAAALLEGEHLIPHLAHRFESYHLDLPSEASALSVASVDHLQYLLQETLGLPTNTPAHVRGALNRYWSKQAEAYEARWREAGVGALSASSSLAGADVDALRKTLALRQRARALVTASLHEQFQFNEPAHAELRARYGLTPQQLDTPSGRAALAAQALKTGLSRVVSFTLADGLDTHDGQWAADHSARLEAGFDALAKLLNDLSESPAPDGAGGSLLDQTMVVVTSEFSRTPRLNARGGRDHHLANAALLIGGGVRGAQTFGETSPRFMGPLKVDLTTGRADPNGAPLRPQELMITALHALGLEPPQQVRGALVNALLTSS